MSDQPQFHRKRFEKARMYATENGGSPRGISFKYGDLLLNFRTSEANRVFITENSDKEKYYVANRWYLLDYDNSGVGCIGRKATCRIEDPIEFYANAGRRSDFEFVELDPEIHQLDPVFHQLRPEIVAHVEALGRTAQVWFAPIARTVYVGPANFDPMEQAESPNSGPGVAGLIKSPGWIGIPIRTLVSAPAQTPGVPVQSPGVPVQSPGFRAPTQTPGWVSAPIQPPVWVSAPIQPPVWSSAPIQPPVWSSAPIQPPVWSSAPTQSPGFSAPTEKN